MSFYTYILFSKTLDRFYVGSTGDELNERLRRHNSNHKGYTGKADDWKLVYSESFSNISEARKRELTIKKWKSRKKISQLVQSMLTGASVGS